MTAAGDGLRVRSRPEVSADSKKLTPLLAAGSRMLVVNGPVPADGYDWYEVRADNDLFGWVAAGKDGEDWIAPAPPTAPTTSTSRRSGPSTRSTSSSAMATRP